jgi:hypothetical protein
MSSGRGALIVISDSVSLLGDSGAGGGTGVALAEAEVLAFPAAGAETAVAELGWEGTGASAFASASASACWAAEMDAVAKVAKKSAVLSIDFIGFTRPAKAKPPLRAPRRARRNEGL